MCAMLTACASPRPYKYVSGEDDVACGVEAAVTDSRCFHRTPEVSAEPGSTEPSYTLHFVEFDDQGWLYPARNDKDYSAKFGSASEQLDRAVTDVAARLAKNERVLLLVYVHGWKHSAAHDDRDVRRFRQMLSDAAHFDSLSRGDSAENSSRRSVIGIYVGWRGAGLLSRANPLIYLSFWTRKNAALHVSEGAARELFARVRGLRERWNAAEAGRPRLRTVVIGHSFGGWVAFSALSPSILELLAHRRDIDERDSDRGADTWRRARLTSAADMVILVNPAFEATRYQPVHNLAQQVGTRLSEYTPPALLLVTSTADMATRRVFPIGRFFNTLFQHPFVSDEQAFAAKRTPGFVDAYITHELKGGIAGDVNCSGWRIGNKTASSAEGEKARLQRMLENAVHEKRRHDEWRAYLAGNKQSLPDGWSWDYCGGTTISHKSHAPHSPVWNVITDREVIPDHSDITGEALHAFFRQIYLDLPQ